MGNDKASEYFDKVTDKWNKEVFRILSMLRLTQEGNIEVADKVYKMRANYKCNNIERRGVSSQDNPISVYDLRDLSWGYQKSIKLRMPKMQIHIPGDCESFSVNK